MVRFSVYVLLVLKTNIKNFRVHEVFGFKKLKLKQGTFIPALRR